MYWRIYVIINKSIAWQYEGLSWSWSHGSWMYNYLSDKYLSPPKLWVWIPLRCDVLDTTLYHHVILQLSFLVLSYFLQVPFKTPLTLSSNPAQVRCSCQGVSTSLCDKVCQWFVASRWFSPSNPFPAPTKNVPPLYRWNIVESGVKHHNSEQPWQDVSSGNKIYCKNAWIFEYMLKSFYAAIYFLFLVKQFIISTAIIRSSGKLKHKAPTYPIIAYDIR